jgi:hypothetical protein
MLYFIRGKESGNIKIGFSTNPDKRKSNLQTAHYEELEFIGIMSGTLEDEARIHEMFAEFNIRGEWFKATPKILEYVEKNANKPEKNIVTSLGDNEYRITYYEPFKYTMKFFMLVSSHNIRVLSDREYQLVFGVEGKRETLLSWYRSLSGVAPEVIDELDELMTS